MDIKSSISSNTNQSITFRNQTLSQEKRLEGNKDESKGSNIDRILKNFYEGLNIKTPITCKNNEMQVSEFKVAFTNTLQVDMSENNNLGLESGDPKEIVSDLEEKIETEKTNKNILQLPSDSKWKFEIRSHPTHLLKHLKGFYNKYNILSKDFGFNVFELTKGKLIIQSNIIEAGPRDPKYICFKLIKGSVSKADEIVKKVQYELELFEKDKKDKKGNN